jgi:hypothetical protein
MRRLLVAVLLGVALAPLSAAATQIELLQNGDFEAGSLAGWQVVDLPGGSGTFLADDADGLTPLAGLPTVGPSQGLFYAVSDQPGPGTHALAQAFTVPPGMISLEIRFDLFANDWANATRVAALGLDHGVVPNQHARVDLLTASADPFDTASGVVANLFLGADAGSDPNGWRHYAFDVTPLVTEGATYRLRFAETDNQGSFNLGVDEASVVAVVPEPGATLCFAAGLILVARRLARLTR